MKNIKDIHVHELDVGVIFGNYRVIECSPSIVHAEDLKTGEISRFHYLSGRLVHSDRY